VPRERIEEMHRAYVDGCLTMEAVGRAYGIGGERVGELFKREGLPAITPSQRGANRTVSERLEHGDRIAAGVSPYGREYLAECVALAAAENDSESLSSNRYIELAREWGLPSLARVIQVFGNWTEAAKAAGLRPNPPGRGNYERRFTYEDVLDAVRACAAEIGHPPSEKQYDEWQRRSRPEARKGYKGRHPSATLARNLTPHRRWALLMADAFGAPLESVASRQ
jgi:hypothetical protein